jgi:NAD(P)-dependent dehydrogenase (short-subunit alcohol dehydrogenase family)
MTRESTSLEGKVAVITGAAGGIGREVAGVFAKAGADVAVTDFRAELLETTREGCQRFGRKAIALLADITDSQQVDYMIESALKALGKIDILANIAGILRRGESREVTQKPIWELTDKDWHMGMAVNLYGAFYCCRAVAKHMLERRSGKIINMASAEGWRAKRDNYAYDCAKGAVLQLSRVLAMSLAPYNIQVNSISPGYIDSTGQMSQGSRATAMVEYIPLGRAGIPSDVSSLALFLASNASDYITGADFIIDGAGLTQCGPTGYTLNVNIGEL